ncbi:PSD1 and planctomycete cytochrome C domain-containing protein [Candidatus Laterigemmans baculatus]|uniref:PSD1 and planctomycete cytochrome C domain-containing protein n=1 Tax=Candidatus Laterigemmans baculatus TaxID=2770505 RepID=UPI0013DC9511|nr:PSD1 and planctomycete cytochrome C domain-containing protein [Candidatus Laterigemmans baculatus]
MRRTGSFLAIIAALCCTSTAARAETDGGKYFEQYVRPLLAGKCVKCHGPEKQEGGLRLDSLEAMLKGGDSGPAVVAGEVAESLLVEAVRYESFEMPPSAPLPEEDVARFVDWIAAGAVWPEHGEAVREVSGVISESDRQWWAFQPLRRPEVPAPEEDSWSRTEIDRFIYDRLVSEGIEPAPQAAKEQLVRRVYYDLIGLPPTPEELAHFVADESPDAWERLIDRLLEDHRYGEHWGRYWLDLVRYAESDGWNQDAYRPHIWRYRDYVVRSFNDDKPYPQFVREQLAGDEIPGPDPEALAATGYLRLGIYEYNQRDARSLWDDSINEITDVTADVFIGMGMACARCHDHKFDPILQKDYFQLRAFFEPLIWRDDVPMATEEELAAYERQHAAWLDASAEVQQEIEALLKPYYDRKWVSTVEKFPLDIQACFHKPVEERTSWEHQMAYLIGRQFEEEGGGPLKSMKKEDKARYEELKKQLAEFDHLKPEPLPGLMTVADFPGTLSPTLIPDSADQEPIPPGFLTVLSEVVEPVEPQRIDELKSSGRRTALAEWIGKEDNPLTTRVIVNRIWQQHFGQGIVPTASDFGHLGLPPTHPDLLDWLTVTFVEEGWSFKKLHKRILMSAVWQQSSLHSRAAENQVKDPAESLLWRFPVRRLNAEQIRDSMLIASGELEHHCGGPSVDGAAPRRSLYVKFYRNNPDTFLQLFDVANGLKSVAERNRTTTPIQSLMMLNGDWTLTRAKKMAERLQEHAGSPHEMLKTAFRLSWGREPTPSELEQSLAFVGESLPEDRVVDLCHVLLNSNEFLYVD